MNLLSFNFLFFLVVLTFFYFLLPKRYQWQVLLIGSLFFYFLSGPKNIIFILITAFLTWISTNYIDKLRQENRDYINRHRDEYDRAQIKALRKKTEVLCKRVMILTLVINFGMLVIFKYLLFIVQQVNSILSLVQGGHIPDTWSLIIPLGISYYTFQTMGYVIDVYWKKTPAEKNFGKVLLFTTFFPQITQGPISNFAYLCSELFSEHSYSYRNFSFGAMRMLWGYFKKMAIANSIAILSKDLYLNYANYTGITVLLGTFMFSVQIYADFSGYMDIVCGFCEILGIRLTENFERPYFSKSVAEYWRRWHISLGNWFKNYLYYPIALSKWAQSLGNKAGKRFGRGFGRILPASVSLVVVWLTTGLWHGASWAYIAWGGVNGLFILFSLWMEPVYENWKKRLHINEQSFWWRAFQVIRTFFIISLIKILPEVGSLGQGLGLWKQIFTNHSIPTYFRALVPMAYVSYVRFLVICLGTALLFVTSLIQRKQPVRVWLCDHVPYYLRILLFVALLMITIYVGFPLIENGGFMYEQF